MYNKLNSMLDHFLEMGVPGYDCLILKDGKEIYRRLGGYADPDNKLPMTGKERYNIYSFSKAITCTAAMQLWEKGLFDLEDPLYKYLPEYAEMTVLQEDGSLKKAENTILIRHLFTMSAGLSYNVDFAAKVREEKGEDCTTREMIRSLAEVPLRFEPGTRYLYSLCHDVLAAVIEVITGQKFGAYCKEHIFDPLGLEKTTFMLPDDELDTITPQFRFNNETKKAEQCGKQIQKYKLSSAYESGGAGGISTIEEYAKILEGVRTGVLLKKETLAFMQEDRLTEETRPYYWYTTHGYGLGTRVPIKGKSYDFGWGSAAGMFHLVDVEHGIVAVYCQHVLGSPNTIFRKTVLGPTITNAVLGYEAVKAFLPEGEEETLGQYI